MSDETSSSSDAAVKAALEDVLSGMSEAVVGEPQPVAKPAAALASTSAPKPEEPNEDAAAAAKSALVDRALKRIAERERRVAERENALDKPSAEKKWNKATIAADQDGWLRANGFDPGKFYRAGMAKVLGDKSPDEYRRIASQLMEEGSRDETTEGLREEIAALKARLETQDQSRTVARYQAEYQSQLDAHLAGDLAEYTHVSRSLKDDKDWTVGAILNIVRADAQAKLSSHRPGEPPPAPMTPAEAVGVLNKELGAIARRLGMTEPAPAQADSKTKTKDAQVPPASARKTLTASQPLAPTPAGDPNDLDANFREAMSWLKSLE